MTRLTMRGKLLVLLISLMLALLGAVVNVATAEGDGAGKKTGQDSPLVLPAAPDAKKVIPSVAPAEHEIVTRIISDVRTIAYSPDGQILAGGGEDGVIRLWSLKKQMSDHHIDAHDTVQLVHFCHDGQTMQAAGRSVKKWNVTTRELMNSVELETQGKNRISRLFQFSADDQMLAGHLEGGTSALTLWDAETGKIKAAFDLVGIPLRASFSHDGRLLAVGTIALGEGKSTGAVQILDVILGQTRRVIEANHRFRDFLA